MIMDSNTYDVIIICEGTDNSKEIVIFIPKWNGNNNEYLLDTDSLEVQTNTKDGFVMGYFRCTLCTLWKAYFIRERLD